MAACGAAVEGPGFKKDDENWKPTDTLLRNLSDVVAKGGNYLLNVGPTAAGEIPTEIVKRLEDIGRWMAVNDEAIHGTTASPFRRLAWGRCTQKPGKLYLHVFDWPEGELRVPGLKSQVQKAYLLAAQGRALLTTSRMDNDVIVKLPVEAPDKIASSSVVAHNCAILPSRDRQGAVVSRTGRRRRQPLPDSGGSGLNTMP